MRRVFLCLLFLLALTPSVFAAEDAGIDTKPLLDSLPEAAGQAMPDISPEESGSLWDGARSVLTHALGQSGSSLRSGLKLCATLLGVTTLCSVVGMASQYGGAATVAGALGICTALVGTFQAMVSLSADTVQSLTDYGLCLLPVLASATAMSGSFTTATTLYTITVLFANVLMQLISKLLIPAVYFFLAIATAEAALASNLLTELREFVGWLISKSLHTMLYLFLGFLSMTSVISGAADAAAVKATKATISGMVPVVGGILSDASETLLASASLLKSSIGVFGMVAVLAICLLPFFKVGIQYFLLKLTAAVSGTVAVPSHVKLLKQCSAAMGYLLAMCGACGLLMLIATVCFSKVVL